MEPSFLAARIISFFFILMGIAMFVSSVDYEKLFDDLVNSPSSLFIVGFINVVLGMILVHSYTLLLSSWTFLIALLGWIMLIKGAFIILTPKSLHYFKGMAKHAKLIAPLIILIGVLYGYFGFFNPVPI